MGRIHPNVLKLRKQKRNSSRRAYLTTKFSIIHVPRTLGMSGIPEDARPMFSYADHLKGNNALFEPFLKAVLPSVAFCLEPTEEQKLIELIQHEEVVDFFTVRDAPIQHYRLSLVFNRKKTVLFFVKVDFANKIVEKSKQYGSYDRAMFDLQHNRISYHHVLPLHSLHLVLPNR